ncbi:MAG: hypothetical protein U0R68_11930 [Candidatus Nanopelagicales bacterium]
MIALRRSAPLLAGVLLLAGCAATSSGSASPSGSGSDAAAEASRCPGPGEVLDATTSGHQPAGAVVLGAQDSVVAVVRCSPGEKDVPGEGSWQVVTEETATTGLEPLVAALRAPAPTASSRGCLDYLLLVPWIGLELADGRFVRPVVPLDSCGHPSSDTLKALQDLSWEQGPTTRLRQVRTPEQVELAAQAVAIGCPDALKDVLGMSLGERTWTSTADQASLPAGPAVLCRYLVGTAPYDATAPGFQSGNPLTAAQRAAIARAVAASGAPRPCASASPTVALVVVGESSVEVETAGCHRVLVDWTAAGQASPELLALVA